MGDECGAVKRGVPLINLLLNACYNPWTLQDGRWQEALGHLTLHQPGKVI